MAGEVTPHAQWNEQGAPKLGIQVGRLVAHLDGYTLATEGPADAFFVDHRDGLTIEPVQVGPRHRVFVRAYGAEVL